MKIYHYNKNTKEFIGESDAEKSPLDKSYLIPAFATIKKPNKKKGFVSLFVNDEWILKEDNRGKKLFNKLTKQQIVLKDPGPIPDEYTDKEPSEFDDWVGDNWVKNTAKEIEKEYKKEYEVLNKNINNLNILNILISKGVLIEADLPEQTRKDIQRLNELKTLLGY
jgi:hypothetical protein